MPKHDHQANEPSVDGAPPANPIRILVGYPWSKDELGKVVSARSDLRWQSISGYVKSAATAVRSIAEKRLPAQCKLDIQVARLRGSHGQMLLENIFHRIIAADILVMDIGSGGDDGLNPNVLVEVGIAIGLGFERRRSLYILKPKDRTPPSDLNGFLFSDYSADGAGSCNRKLSIIDSHGFRAALRATIFSMAMERGMIGTPRKNSVEEE